MDKLVELVTTKNYSVYKNRINKLTDKLVELGHDQYLFCLRER